MSSPKHEEWQRSLSLKDRCALEEDLEQGRYQAWVETYPEHIYDIFGQYLCTGFDNPVTLEDIRYFQTHGIDLNAMSHAYYCDSYYTNALQMACEWRRLDLMEMLLQAGANVNLVTEDGFSPLDSAVLGHGANWIYETQQIQACFDLLSAYGLETKTISQKAASLLPMGFELTLKTTS